MVNDYCNKTKKFKFYFKKVLFLAIILVIIANFNLSEAKIKVLTESKVLILGNVVFAKKVEINEKDVERIKTSLDLMKTLLNIAIGEDKLKTILNTTVSVGEMSTDITYGVLILSALNEMELIDLVVSQRYKTEAKNYFNSILDERLNLFNYYSGIGFDLPRVISGAITGQMSALTLNTFSVTNEAIKIFVAFNNVKLVKMYDGLWVYFDLRQNSESHDVAWSDAKDIVGFAIQPTSFLGAGTKENNSLRLELQFSSLWNKWGPHITSNGVKEEFKQQVQKELQLTLTSVIETYKLAEETHRSSLWEKAKSYWKNLVEKIGRLRYFVDIFRNLVNNIRDKIGSMWTSLASILSRIGLGTITQIQEGEKLEERETEELEEFEEDIAILEEEIKEIEPLREEQGSGSEIEKLTLKELQDRMDDLSERIDVMSQRIAGLIEPNTNLDEVQEDGTEEEIAEDFEEEAEEMEEATGVEFADIEQEETDQPLEIELCEELSGSYSVRNKMLINEIAWMGTTNSANDEWIELKNISESEVNLNGWQLLDKDNKIKAIFDNQYTIQANGFLLLERTDDDTLPELIADLIYTGALGNTDETLYLFDENCQLQDKVFALPSWAAGDNSSKRTMERKVDLGWQTSSNIGGTPKRENSSGYYPYYGGGGAISTPPETPETLPSLPPPKILINEIQIESQASEKEDFVELYNPNDEDIDLTNWYIQRKTKGASSFLTYVKKDLFSGKIIKTHDYFLIANTSSTFLAEVVTIYPLTEDNTLYLKNSEGEIIDKVGWGQAQDFETFPTENPQPGKSIGRKWSSTTKNYIDTDNNYQDFEIQTPTPGIQNKAGVKTENQRPIASFVYTPQNPIIGEQILFNASSSTDSDGQIISFIWDFADGSSTRISQATITHSFATSNQYTISLQVINDKGATSSLATTTISVAKGTGGQEIPTLSIVINEIAWMGTGSGSALRVDEWIELYNTTSTDIDLNNWTLSWAHGTTTYSITFSTSTAATTTISANGFYLIERTNDDAVSDISADWFGAFGWGLNNKGEKLELRDDKGNLIDVVDCSSDWFAGTTNLAYISMERINPVTSGADSQNWANNNLITRNGKNAVGDNINGTPRALNSASISPTFVSRLPFEDISEITLTSLGSPYVIENNLSVDKEKTLRIEPGVILKFSNSRAIEIKGTLLAEGGMGIDEKIFLTSLKDDEIGGDTNEDGALTQPNPGDWTWLYFNGSMDSKLKNVVIKYGGRLTGGFPIPVFTRGMIQVEDGNIIIEDSIIEKSQTIGLWLINSSSTINKVSFLDIRGADPKIYGETAAVFIEGGSPMISNSTFKGNKTGIEIKLNSTPQIEGNIFENNTQPIYFNGAYPFFDGNSVENNIFNGVLVGPGYLSTTTWQADLPYILNEGGAVAPGAILTLKPGVIIKLGLGKSMSIYGRILAQGVSGQPIVFTSLKDDEHGGDSNNDDVGTQASPSDWGNFRFSTSDSVLDNVIVRYGGREGSPWWINTGVIALEKDVEIEIKNSVIEKNIYAVSFASGTGCDTITEAINQFEAKNTIFQDNKYLTYPKCSIP